MNELSVIAGRTLGRRDFLRLSGLATLALTGLPVALSGCGKDPRQGASDRAIAGRSIAISLPLVYAPAMAIKALAADRAQRRGATLTLAEDPPDAAVQNAVLTRWSGERGGFRVIAIAPLDASDAAPIVRRAAERGVKVVSFVTPIEGQAAGIEVDPRASAVLLADDAKRFAAASGKGSVKALLVRPPLDAGIVNPFRERAGQVESALLAEISRSGAIDAVATTEAQATADAAPAVERALAEYPAVRCILCWNDETALGALKAVRSRGGESAGWYVGATTVPSVSNREVLRELKSGGPLRCVVAARPSELASALVDLPLEILRRGDAESRRVAPRSLTRGGDEIARFARELSAPE